MMKTKEISYYNMWFEKWKSESEYSGAICVPIRLDYILLKSNVIKFKKIIDFISMDM